MMVRAFRPAIALALVLTALPLVVESQETPRGVRIGLSYGAGVKPGVIVMPVEATRGDSVRAIVQRDLDYGDRVTVIALDSAALRGLTPAAGRRFNYQLFARLGAAAIVRIVPTAGGYRAEVHDVTARRVLRADTFAVAAARPSGEWRMEIHGMADEIERWITGVKGMARSRALFVRGSDVWMVDSDGANQRQITRGALTMSPAWHPNGRMIAYSRYGSAGTRIELHDLETGSRRIVRATPEGLNITPAFSPDGQHLVWATNREGGTEIVAASLANLASARRVTVGRGTDNTSPSFSPDGRKIAFMSGRAGQPEVYISDSDGTNVQLLTEFTFGGTSYRASPAWSPDGRLIAYQATAGGFQIMVLNLRDRAVKQLTSAGVNEDPSWAPDGRHIVFTSNRSGVQQLWVIDSESGRLRQLTHAAGARLADWSPYLAPTLSNEQHATNTPD
jgi:TolB protein